MGAFRCMTTEINGREVKWEWWDASEREWVRETFYASSPDTAFKEWQAYIAKWWDC